MLTVPLTGADNNLDDDDDGDIHQYTTLYVRIYIFFSLCTVNVFIISIPSYSFLAGNRLEVNTPTRNVLHLKIFYQMLRFSAKTDNIFYYISIIGEAKKFPSSKFLFLHYI